VKFWEWNCISAPGLLGVLGTGARISVDILELGSYLVGREELGFGQCLAEAVKKASDGQTKVISIRFKYYFKLCIVLISYKILLIDKFVGECAKL
jgi:hypothetical protein